VLTSYGKDTVDVEKRIKQASGAFGSLLKCVFKRKDITKEANVAVYNSLILSIPLYDSVRVVGGHQEAPRQAARVPP
jgi:hypothetical protein